jgi:hypothetical protein
MKAPSVGGRGRVGHGEKRISRGCKQTVKAAEMKVRVGLASHQDTSSRLDVRISIRPGFYGFFTVS